MVDTAHLIKGMISEDPHAVEFLLRKSDVNMVTLEVELDKVIAAIQDAIRIKPGETTPDKQVSLLTARCIGACGIAPAVVYDGTVTPRQSPADAVAQLKKWM